MPSKEQLLNDLKYLYNMLLNPQTMHVYKPVSRLDSARLAATKLLNCKHLIKHYDKEDDLAVCNPFSIQITCNINVVGDYKDTVCPPEIFTLPITASVGDLKAEATKAVNETYFIYQNFEADQLLDCKVASETTQVKLLFGSRGSALISGFCHGGRRKLGIYQMEQGVEKWMVNCVCGTRDDDGERMLACDLCGVWQHTRCSDIKDAEDVPKKFVCRLCKGATKN
jgi:PHD-finger